MKDDLFSTFLTKSFRFVFPEHKMGCGPLFVNRNAKILFKNGGESNILNRYAIKKKMAENL